ncbi:LysR family transcriptional regulator [Duganella radicis]|nr:LysR family transcriptional regulator [Duganella radicis]
MNQSNRLMPIRRFSEGGLKINQLRILVALQQLGQVYRVADALHVTQPAISKQLRELENITGVSLFRRAGNRIEFTVMGERLARRAGEILQQLTNAEVEIAALAQGVSGTVAIGTVTTAAQVLVPQAIRRFRELAPGARIKLHEGPADGLLEMLEEGKLDVVVARGTEKDGPPSTQSTVLSHDPLVLCSGLHHPLAGHRELGWGELATTGWIVPSIGSLAYKALARLLQEKQIALDVAVESMSLTTNVAMLDSSELVCLLPLSYARRLVLEHRIVMLPVATDGLLAQVSAHWKADSDNPLTLIMTDSLIECGKAL